MIFNKKNWLYFLLILASIFTAKASSPEVSLLTFDPGHEAYSVFGHTAIRVNDQENQRDWVYNFGIFDFDTPFFLAKFSTGTLDYKLGIQDYEPMLGAYFYENRQVFEQKLLLNEAETKALIAQLEFAYQPENRYYRYRFLRRNCSTEVRDILLTGIIGANYEPTNTQRTFRDFLNDYTRQTPWFKFGINLALGSTIDQEIDTFQVMFLPDYLKQEITKATLNGAPLVGKTKAIFKNLKPYNPSKWQLSPLMVFTAVLILLIFIKSKLVTRIFLGSVGLMGLVVLTISLTSQHPEVHYNYNLLWMNPLYLISAFFRFSIRKKLLNILAIICLVCLLAVLVIWITGVQDYELAFIPIVISLLWLNLRQRQFALKTTPKETLES